MITLKCWPVYLANIQSNRQRSINKTNPYPVSSLFMLWVFDTWLTGWLKRFMAGTQKKKISNESKFLQYCPRNIFSSKPLTIFIINVTVTGATLSLYYILLFHAHLPCATWPLLVGKGLRVISLGWLALFDDTEHLEFSDSVLLLVLLGWSPVR